MNDHELERLARQLGTRTGERLDVETIARAVTRRLQEEPQARGAAWALPEWLRVAAMVVLLLGAGFALQRVNAGPGAALPYTLSELGDLTASELSQLLQGMDGALEGTETDSMVVDLDQLTPAQLQTLLRSLET